ncbi:hypothetical protein ACFV6W_31415, partial [Streptomyces sp. NPDC059802]
MCRTLPSFDDPEAGGGGGARSGRAPPAGPRPRRFVREDSRTGLLADEDTGAVLKVSSPTWFGTGPRYAEPAWSRAAGKSWADHLVALDPGERERWAVRRQPGSEEERARWWWFLLVACRQRIPAGPDGERERWAKLTLWLIGKCRTAGVLDRTEAALQIAGGSLLPPDETVRMCLDAIPVWGGGRGGAGPHTHDPPPHHGGPNGAAAARPLTPP